MSQSLAPIGLAGWSLVGTVETGFNPYYGYLADAQRSQVQNNGKALTLQGANNDSSRTGQWDNSQGFIGISNKTYGTLTVGRVNTLSLDAINSYDPMGGSYAFSPLGFSGSFAGFGDTEAARANSAVKYRTDIPYPSFYGANFRVAGLVQWGGYDQGNGMNGLYQGQVGADFNVFRGSPFGGVLSMDAIGSWAKDVGERRHLHRDLRDADKRTVCRGNRVHVRHSHVLQQHRRDRDAFEQYRFPVHREVQGAGSDSVRRLRLAPADRPERRFFKWVSDYRRLERSSDHQVDESSNPKAVSNRMDELHQLRHPSESLRTSGSARNTQSRLSST